MFYLNKVALFKHKDDDYPAGFEVSEQENEYYRFSSYDPTKINNSGVYSRTGSSAYLLSGSTQVSNQVIGPAKSIRVYPGDALHMEVYGKYLSSTGGGTNVGSVIAGALQSAFGLSAGGATDVAYQSVGNLFGDGSLIGTVTFPEEDGVPPKAFLNYIMFDDNYIPYDFGYDQIGTNGELPGGVDKMALMAKVRKPGYIYIYLSNKNEVTQEVYFDDLALKHVKGVAIQQSDYYPFGLTFNSYQRENSVEQRWKFQGQEYIDDLGLNWDSFKWRNHQADIGRFFNIDPIAEDYYYNSPYAFSENQITSHVEIEGLESQSIHLNIEIKKLESTLNKIPSDFEKLHVLAGEAIANIPSRIQDRMETFGFYIESPIERLVKGDNLKAGDTVPINSNRVGAVIEGAHGRKYEALGAWQGVVLKEDTIK